MANIFYSQSCPSIPADLDGTDIFYIDCIYFWLSLAPQQSATWFKERQFRLTMSNLATAIGLDKHHSIDKYIYDVVHNIGLDPNPAMQADLERGNLLEPRARNYYMACTGYTIVERGLAIPKWCPYILGSIDGEILGTDDIIEIKCPFEVYAGLIRYLEMVKINPQADIKNYIPIKHYCQMQGNMAIWGKKRCHYIVYVENPEIKCYYAIVNFNQQWWDNVATPKIKYFISRVNSQLHPDIVSQMIPRNIQSLKNDGNRIK